MESKCSGRRLSAYFILAVWVLAACPSCITAEVHRVKYQAGGNYLIVEVLDDDLAHFEYGKGPGPGADIPVKTTAMVCNEGDNVPAAVCTTGFSGPAQFSDNGAGVLETGDIRLVIDTGSLHVTAMDKTKGNLQLTTFRPYNLQQAWKGLTFTRSGEMDVYGLGQQFVEAGNANIDWDGRVRESGPYGNVMKGFNGGSNGNTQIPVMYSVNGATHENYALFLDNKYKQRWDFTGESLWTVEMFGDRLRFYLMTGPDLPDLRKDYMELVGRPLVPPRKAFGLWVSEYGYDDWGELDDRLQSLRAGKFPVDGFVLDLQWFGGRQDCSDDTQMGSLTWDTQKFPNPSRKIGALRDNHGVGIMLIEEAYVGKNLPEYSDLKNRGCLVKKHAEDPDSTYLTGECTGNCWWGKGGMIDYTNDSCSDYWHDAKRRHRINEGVIGHWTDLGEPEMYPAIGCPDTGAYADGAEADAHNVFNLKWLRGIYRGYSRNNVEQRPFMMSRSGAAGIQRFGAAMWSGDIASRLSSLAAHAANQMHMSLSGIDYYGGDIGGFHRNLEGDLDEMYTQWYAYGMMFDVPGRPHTENLCNCKETAPDRIGDKAGNLGNTRLRYELVPYLYSLAHRAYRFGEPLMPPPVLYYQTDENVRNMGHEKMIGRDLLAAVVAKHGETQRDVYLPAGTWIDWHTNQRIQSGGIWLPDVQAYRNGKLTLPLYAREGAVIPMMFVDDKTMNALGRRSDGTAHDELIVKVFAFDGGGSSTFTLYEDDGNTIAYQEGEVRATDISHSREGNIATVKVNASEGTYDGSAASRNNLVKLVADNVAADVTLNGNRLSKHSTLDDFMAADSGWVNAGDKTIMAKSGVKAVNGVKEFAFTLGEIPDCTSEYGSISMPGAGNGWDPADPDRTFARADCEGKVWHGRVRMCKEEYKFAADGTWTRNWGSDGQQDGPNFPPLAWEGIYDVVFDENDPANPEFNIVEYGPCPVSGKFICENGRTMLGTSVYVVGSVPELGEWNPDGAVKLNPDGPYPKWTGSITNLPPETRIQWKCIKRLEGGDRRVIQWKPGENNEFTTPESGDAGEQAGAF
jgi:alpha-glucosidase